MRRRGENNWELRLRIIRERKRKRERVSVRVGALGLEKQLETALHISHGPVWQAERERITKREGESRKQLLPRKYREKEREEELE